MRGFFSLDEIHCGKILPKISSLVCFRLYGLFLYWEEMLIISNDMEDHLLWIVWQGNINFWCDYWILRGCIRSAPDHSEKYVTIRDFWINNKWDFTQLSIMLNSSDLKFLADNICINNEVDKLIWKVSSSMDLISAARWEYVRQMKSRSFILCRFWHNLIPVKISILCGISRFCGNESNMNAETRTVLDGVSIAPRLKI